MEVLDLPVCHFCKYRPGTSSRGVQFAQLIVPRDREWRTRYLPQLEAFWREVVTYRQANPTWHIAAAPTTPTAAATSTPPKKRARRSQEGVLDLDA